MFNNVFKDKKVLITGNTGFKGSWLSQWMLNLGANVYGISDRVLTTPSLFVDLDLQSKMNHHTLDLRNFDETYHLIESIQPDFIFHLAAQAIVSESFENPRDTFSTNLMASVNILECIRVSQSKFPCVVIMITSDKCYENVEWIYGYREQDALGGKDPYSASKACAELAISAYYRSFLNEYSHIKMASARAGNVIGGGDWSKDRLVPDCFRAWSQNKKVTIRCPKSTRPWQHVLEPLSGYMLLAQSLFEGKDVNGESFNFGPHAIQDHTVLEVLNELSSYMKLDFEPLEIIENKQLKEAGLLKLNCDKALSHLKWLPTMNYKDTMNFTGSWYQSYFSKEDMELKTNTQISKYQEFAIEKKQVWTL